MAWSSLVHRLNEKFKEQPPPGRKLLCLLSGGGDSVALASALLDLKEPYQFELTFAHCHHGSGVNDPFRDQALGFCQQWAKDRSVSLIFKKSDIGIRSEAEARIFRLSCVSEWQKTGAYESWVSGHMMEDLLETRFFRLLRGTGPDGLEAMKENEGFWWRPLLSFSRAQLREHLEWNKERFLEDPSNQDLNYKRNFIRHQLLPLLEKEWPGATQNLSLSLARIVENLTENQAESPCSINTTKGLLHSQFLTLSPTQQRQVLARYLWALGIRDFRHTQVQEIQKLLDISQVEHTFRLAGCEWRINAGQILAVPLSKNPA